MGLTAEDMALFKDLRMAEFGRVIQEIIDDPDRDHDSFEDKVKEALYAQRNARDSRRIDRLIREASLQQSVAALERFDVSTDRGLTADRIKRLAGGDWIIHGQDISITGATGTGKSFLAQALGVNACRMQFPTRYFRMADLADEFDMLRDDTIERKKLMTSLMKASLVIIDDFLATTVSQYALEQVFNLLVVRERSSTVIASQHQPDYWYSVFSDAAIADAVLSRLSNNGVLFRLKGEDMRTRCMEVDSLVVNTTIPRHVRR